MINGSSTFWSIQFLASLIFLILVLQSLLDIFSNFFRLFDVPDWLHFLVAASEYFSVKLKFSDHAVFNYVKYYAYVLLSVIGCFIIYLVGDYIYSDVTRYVPALWRDLTFVPEIVILSKPDPKTGIRLKIVQNEKAA